MKEAISARQIGDILQLYGVLVSPELSESIRTYISLLLRWNEMISLTTVVDPTDIIKFHFGESLFAASALAISHGRLADVGSGAGFPGLPLAMLLSELDVVLIESNSKKATFLSEVVRVLGLGNATIWRGRMEEFSFGEERFDILTARALGQHEHFLEWSKSALKPSGQAALWLGESEALRVCQISGWRWRDRIHIPGSERRVLLAGSPL